MNSGYETSVEEGGVTLNVGQRQLISFVIVHHPSTITSADKIVVIHDGKIIKQGTHSELLANQVMCYEVYRTAFQD